MKKEEVLKLRKEVLKKFADSLNADIKLKEKGKENKAALQSAEKAKAAWLEAEGEWRDAYLVFLIRENLK